MKQACSKEKTKRHEKIHAVDFRPVQFGIRRIKIWAGLFVLTFLIAACRQSSSKISYPYPFMDPEKPLEERVQDLIARMTLEEKCSQMRFNSPAIERLGIPAYNWWSEALHGVARSGKATVFPQCIGLAATFDDSLIHRIATAISDEARAKFNIAQRLGNRGQYAGLTFWSPNVNLFRDPRWGRGQETWGEDPFLTSRMGVAFVKGMQGNHPRYLKTGACAKHYVVHSGPEKDRHTFNALPSKKDFFETYTPAFKALVQEANVEAVMCAYNRTYDWPCCGSKYLLQDILRKEWGFKNHIVSDCGAIMDFHLHHRVTKSPEESAALAANSGVNLNCGEAYLYLAEAVKKGLVSEKTINENLAILLRTRFKLGLFDPPTLNPWHALGEEVIECPAHVALAREAAAKSVVLLKNNNHVLPLSKNLKNLYVIGPHAANVDILLGNYNGISKNMVTILEGIIARVSPGTSVNYRLGCMFSQPTINPINYAIGEAYGNDAIIAVCGISPLIEGEEGESILSAEKGDRISNMRLPQVQIDLLKALRKASRSPLILVLTGGSPIEMAGVDTLADAILYVWYPGQEGGNGVADVLFGDASPAGRLPITFPVSISQLPDFNDYSMKNRTYRYMQEDHQYPFGFGLSYSRFEYRQISVSKKEITSRDTLVVQATVGNTGAVDADEVVQLYTSQKVEGLECPKYSLKGFRRIHLKAGETRQVAFSLTPEQLKLVNNDGEYQWIPGKVTITVGGASPGKRSLELGAPQPVETMIELK